MAGIDSIPVCPPIHSIADGSRIVAIAVIAGPAGGLASFKFRIVSVMADVIVVGLQCTYASWQFFNRSRKFRTVSLAMSEVSGSSRYGCITRAPCGRISSSKNCSAARMRIRSVLVSNSTSFGRQGRLRRG